MRKLIILIVLLSSGVCLNAQISFTEQLLDAMQNRYRGKWFQEFAFKQQTIRYDQEGAARDTAMWYEAVSYPDNFRIDQNPNGRFVIFRNDSSYRFDNYEFQRSAFEPQEFLLFKGGLYFRPINSVLNQLENYGYNTSIFREDMFNGRRSYVIGAEKGDLKTKQFWIDAENFYTVRRISGISRDRTLDLQYSEHEEFNGGWVERTVIILVDGRKVQMEYYLEVDAETPIPKDVFNPKNPSRDWFKQ